MLTDVLTLCCIALVIAGVLRRRRRDGLALVALGVVGFAALTLATPSMRRAFRRGYDRVNIVVDRRTDEPAATRQAAA